MLSDFSLPATEEWETVERKTDGAIGQNHSSIVQEPGPNTFLHNQTDPTHCFGFFSTPRRVVSSAQCSLVVAEGGC